ncbi:Rha family transcriptional regulator [Sansalvadorimonas verongulae]|uniref:Rha family transcriptional regulator n=1 Tax=Sansalvadorimonas verongulae TaxID=2172824 RepID=UPI0012BB94D6|nr:Rha family transcriptional regulator [Sansalvadorimonas verongulae]MTI12056.1 hypothetical protein [Sansalvadorimonas verongulae]
MTSPIINQGRALPVQTMSHVEIAELAGSRPDKVKQSIERLTDKGVVTFTPMGETFLGADGRRQKRTAYHVNQRDSYVVMAQISPEFTGRLVDRWQELEAMVATPPAANLPDFTNPAEAARAWAEQFELKAHAEQEVQRLNHVCNTVARQFVPGLTAPQFCKQLNGVNIQQVNNTLVNRGILIREKRGHSPSSIARDKYFKGTVIPNEGGHVSHQPQLTQKGAVWLYNQYLKNKLPMKQSWNGNLTHMVFTEEVA